MKTPGHCFPSLNFKSKSSCSTELFSLVILSEKSKNQNTRVIWKVWWHFLLWKDHVYIYVLNAAKHQKIKDINICLVAVYHTEVLLAVRATVSGTTLKISPSPMVSEGSLIHCFCLLWEVPLDGGGWTETDTVWYSSSVLSSVLYASELRHVLLLCSVLQGFCGVTGGGRGKGRKQGREREDGSVECQVYGRDNSEVTGCGLEFLK